MGKTKKIALLLAFLASASLSHGEAAPIPLTLDESIEMALQTHESIDAAEAARNAAAWRLSSARRAKGLSFSLQSNAYRIGGRTYRGNRAAHGEDPDRYPDPYENEFSNSMTLTLPLYSGGRLENSIAAGRYGLNAEDLNVESTLQDVQYQTIEAYYDLLQRKNLMGVSEGAVKMAAEQLRLISDQYSEGAVAKADVLQMEVQLANYRQDFVSAKGNLQVAMYRLARLVGLPQDTDIEPKDLLSYAPFPYSMEECEAYAIENRPDSAAARYQVEQAKAQMENEKSGYRPSVSAVLSKSISDNEPFRSSRGESWNAGLRLSWNIFDNSVTLANVHAAKEAVERYRASAVDTEKKAILETRSAYARMRAAEENIRSTSIAVEQAMESYGIAQVRYEEGVDNLIHVTDAQEKLTRAQTNYCNALYNYNLYRATLEKAMGVPVGISVPRYVAAEQSGKSSPKSLEAAAVTQEEREAMDGRETGENRTGSAAEVAQELSEGTREPAQ